MADAASAPIGERSFSALAGVGVLEYGSTLRVAYCGALLAQLGARVIALRPAGLAPPTTPIERAAVRVTDAHKIRVANMAQAESALGDRRSAPVTEIVLIGDGLRRTPHERPRLALAVEVRLDAHEPHTARALGGVEGDALSASAVSAASVAIGHACREPLALPGEFAEHTAGLHGAVATLTALRRRDLEASPETVRVSIAMDECLRFYVGMNAKMYEGYPREWRREGRRSAGSAGPYPVGMFPCADGYVVIVSRSREDWLAIIAAMGSPEWARRPGWEDPLSVAEHHADEADELLEAWLGGLSCADAVALGRRHGFAIARMLDPLEAIATEQMRARRFTQAPGAHVADDIPRLDAPMLPTIVARGEDAADPAGTDARLAGAPAGARGAASRPGGASVPLAELLRGVRVLDLSWVWSGPATTMMLAALGADVVKVESSRRPDGSRLRGRPNTAAGVPVDGPILEVTPYFHQVNAGKRSVELDLHSPDGREAIRALANRSDVLVENMRPGVLARHGLGYASLSETNPGLVMLSMSLAGQHGPLAGAKGYASIMSAMSGLESLVGYSPDDVTGMLTVAVGDPNAATYGVLSVLAALRERERTGYGTLLDLSQIEAAVCGLLGTLSAFADDREAAWGYGNWHAQHAPYGTFPSSDGGWVALAVRDDEEWHGVVDALGDPRLRDARLRLAAARRRERVALNELIAGATSRIERSGLVRRLLLAGVLAVPVLALGERDEDTGFAAPARHAMPMAHPYAPGERLVTPPWDVDGERPQFSMRAPLLGEHTEAVLAGLSTGPRR